MALRGLWYGLKEQGYYAGVLVALILVMTTAYSLVEGNVGTAFRHRAQVMVFLLMFAAVGWGMGRRVVADSDSP